MDMTWMMVMAVMFYIGGLVGRWSVGAN